MFRHEGPLRDVIECHVSSCDVMVAMPPPMLRRPVPAYRASPRFVPTRSVPPAAAWPPGAAGPCFARLIARATRRTHLPRPFPPGCSAPAALCRERKRRPRKPPLPAPIIPHFPTGQAPRRTDPEIAARFRAKRTARLRLAGPRAPESPAGPPPPPTPDTGQETAPAIAARSPPPACRTAAGRPSSASAPPPGLSGGAGRSHGRSCDSGPQSCFPSPVSRRWR